MKVHVMGMLLVLAGTGVGWSQATLPQHGTVPEVAAIQSLPEVLRIGAVIEVMREEGILYGAEMADDLLAGQGGAAWQSAVSAVYDMSEMRRRFDAAFAAALEGSQEVAAIEAFFVSDLGRRVLALEIEGRRALLDPVVEQAAELAFAEMEAADEPRVSALRAFVETNDLIESNVMGALNANLAFYRGLSDVGGLQDAMPEDQMLAEVWAQEVDLRAETENWLYPYLALAYKPLSDEELRDYQAFSKSPAGQAVNAALFAAFDAVFVAVSRNLGRAAAAQMRGETL
jgi:hypothetical protein